MATVPPPLTTTRKKGKESGLSPSHITSPSPFPSPTLSPH
ncbi:hypothetical protein COLO4_03536 [Corchorus olitorius]|uniref:Uncharacterized protein n=1 Tax=Corchorus olitorius TaxID=93759 RepID=A0A1R3KY95_9ROSI|nr:hypothetical protein COLO4_03536 [Corchorus olitorius]